MKKIKKMLFIILVFLSIFFIYRTKNPHQIIYVALGDSLAQGTTPYGNISYSYVDYLADYLKNKQILKYYTKAYTQSGYKITDVVNQIDNNVVATIGNKNIYLKELLRSSDLVTISIGFDDLFNNIDLNALSNDTVANNNLYKKIDGLSLELSNMLGLIKKYAKGTIILVGYYNPLSNQTVNKYITYSDKVFQQVCKDHNVQFVKISDTLSQNANYLPNPLDIHPNSKGYIDISNKIITLMQKKSIIDL
jgi:lysophospholipase L1-like esterase